MQLTQEASSKTEPKLFLEQITRVLWICSGLMLSKMFSISQQPQGLQTRKRNEEEFMSTCTPCGSHYCLQYLLKTPDNVLDSTNISDGTHEVYLMISVQSDHWHSHLH